MRSSETSLTDILGEEFGPYKLVRRLGVGGMAETFVAVRRGPSGFTQRVCLKLVLPFFRDNEDFVALFEREARLAAQLRHRNIVGVIDFGEIEGLSYMALELVDGVDLRTLLDARGDHRLPPGYVALLGLELAEALEHAHNPPAEAAVEANEDAVAGIVHRDISPSNVLLSRQGEILLTDFGVAKAITGTSRRQSAVKGKIPYMSPEQLRAEPLDGRADLFSLGVVLFESLAGKRPYDGAHDPGTIMLILQGEHPSLSDLAPDAPPGLCRAIESLLVPDREKRPSTAAALIEQLDEFTPPTRVRRQLGELVKKLCDQAGAASTRPGSQPVADKTEVLPDTQQEQTGVKRTGDVPNSVSPIADTAVAAGAPGSTPAPPSTPAPTSTPPLASTPVSPPASAKPPPGEAWMSGPVEGVSAPASEPIGLVRPPKEAPPPRGEPEKYQPRYAPPGAPATPGVPSSSPPVRERRWARRELRLMIAGAVLTVGGIAAGLIAWLPSDDTHDQREESAQSEKPEASKEEMNEVRREAEDEVVEPEVDDVLSPADSVIETPGLLGETVADTSDTADGDIAVTPDATDTEVVEPAPQRPQQRPTPQRSTAPGRLTITIFPWGNIWINGQPWGRAPLRNEALAPGRYEISAGQQGPTETQTIRLRAGQRRTISFDLTD